MANYAEVILPVPVRGTFTYAVPEELAAEIMRGQRVYVPFGKRKYYTGIVADIHTREPKGFRVKPVMAILDKEPVIYLHQLKFWRWIAEYYLCTIGEVYKAAVPSGMKVESETHLSLNETADLETIGRTLTNAEVSVLDKVIAEPKVKLRELRMSDKSDAFVARTVNRLVDKGLVTADETAASSYRAKQVAVVCPGADNADSDWLHHAFDAVSGAPKQEKLLVAFLDLIKSNGKKEVRRDELLQKAGVSAAILRAVAEKGILRSEQRVINRFTAPLSGEPVKLPPLSDAQREAMRCLNEAWKEHGVALLHGVTGSGKTEIYCHAVMSALEAGKQVLFLVPEISLTTQLTDRLRKVFGKRLLVYHSRFSDSERVDLWKRVYEARGPLVVLGVRSSLFLPFLHLGLVVVDEEHEASYKQYDPAPRYNARDAAIMLAAMHGAKTLLGSATPAIDTYYKAQNGKYGLVTLSERFQGARLPDVEVVDMLQQRHKNLTDGMLSAPVRRELTHTLAEGRQAIMFQNRRGFAPSVYCTQCGWQPKCLNCDVSMVYHRRAGTLNCHYCGYLTPLPALCPACGQNSIRTAGIGTERIADHIHEKYPEAGVSRMDLDTTRNKDAYQEIIEEFASRRTDILIGTQMVSKGLDFANVSFVGVVNADSLLHFPDFRANERAFNMLVQVAGRAGRRDLKGKVMIQTSDAGNPLLEFVKSQDYKAYYNYELEQRRQFGYPPFTRIITLYIKHRDEKESERLGELYALKLRPVFGNRVLGPAKPSIGKIAGYFIQTIMLKIESGASMKKVKELLAGVYASLADDAALRSAQIYYDVDPV